MFYNFCSNLFNDRSPGTPDWPPKGPTEEKFILRQVKISINRYKIWDKNQTTKRKTSQKKTTKQTNPNNCTLSSNKQPHSPINFTHSPINLNLSPSNKSITSKNITHNKPQKSKFRTSHKPQNSSNTTKSNNRNCHKCNNPTTRSQ